MDPPSPTKTRKTKENARKAAQKKAKKEKKKTMSSQPYQSGSSPARASASDVPPSYLSTFSTSTTSTTPGASASTSTGLPAALLAEVTDDDPPGWMVSWTAAWGQGQKNICIKWVREKREKVVRAEEALAAGHGTDEEVEVNLFISAQSIHSATSFTTAYHSLQEAMMELSEEIDDAIRRGCDMSELQ